MPTLLRWKGYRFFYSADGWEPPHIHIFKNGCEAKIWLHTMDIAINIGFTAHQMAMLVRKTEQEAAVFLEMWHDYFDA